MGVGFGLYMYDIVVKRSRSLSHLLMSSCLFFKSSTAKTPDAVSCKDVPFGVAKLKVKLYTLVAFKTAILGPFFDGTSKF